MYFHVHSRINYKINLPMRINKFGQVTNKSNDLLLTSQQEEFMKSLLDNGKATSLSLRTIAKTNIISIRECK